MLKMARHELNDGFSPTRQARRMMHQISKTLYSFLVAGGLMLFLVLALARVSQSQDNPRSLVVLQTQEPGPLYSALHTVVAHGGTVDHVYPPNAFIGYLPPEILVKPEVIQDAALITQDIVDESVLSQWGEGARIAGYVWNTTVKGLPHAATFTGTKGVPQLLAGDALYAEDHPGSGTIGATEIGQAAGTSQTSEFLIGSSAVAIIFPESNGQIDPSTEDWSVARQDTVIAKIKEGLQWWKDNANAPADITFVYDIKRDVATQYEGINRTSSDHENLVINDIMASLGYTSGNNFTRVRSFLNDRRTALGTTWAFAVFVFDSLNDADGEFPSGSKFSFAYAYFNGPYMVMTYDNDGWGIDRMDLVAAHENGHIWGARDEYASSGCTDTQTSGYLNIANSNCENGDPATEDSIMRMQQTAYSNHLVSTPSMQAVGWRDSDGDGKELYDPVDTTPSVTLSAYSPDPTTDTTPTYTGSSKDTPYPSPTHTAVTINSVRVEWRVDGGAWQNASASDGSFDSDSESFSFTPASPLALGTHLFEVRAINSVGNISSLASDSLTISGFTLTVNKDGSGSGTVTSSPAGIDCGADCNEEYASGTSVTLTSTPSSGSVFAGWNGGGCSGTGTCTVTTDANKSVTATFNTQTTFTLTVQKNGNGSGTVTSSPSGITCGGTCSASFSTGTSVTLTASAASGSVFAGWNGGGCSGTGSCTVTMNAAVSVTATFNLQTFALSVTKGGSGDGTVTATGINCGSDCSETYNSGTSVTLTTSPSGDSSFKGWSGGGCSGTGTCTVTMNADTSVKATFSKTYTDDPITSQSTLIKAAHITDLRQAINTLRSNNSLSAFTFTDSTLTAASTQVRKVHITELRTALDGVYDAQAKTKPTYTNPTITAGQTSIKKAHIAEIRSAVKDVE